ncbi:hypothetical protein CAPTEDRAFT_195063 [Capitella teleta]|uniref:Uncharacterized protein n=1 Tax=Capitella teleta TaxID=283909 RepID=R7UNQ7_CAPTE|nr:hypothetical protein CAPTEDRAFT_195063 [Capitella teleta]|eukprot:ELU05021.1 hypothetical protein CAPTEDRAFT_195063 [Capitella teleta]
MDVNTNGRVQENRQDFEKNFDRETFEGRMYHTLSGTPPAPKRQKKESKPKKESRKKKRPAFSDSDSDELVVFDVGGPAKKSVNRKSLDEKVFDRDLQMAMELSKEVSGMQESEADGAQTKIVVHDNKVKEEIKESGKENKHPLPEPSAGKEKVEKPVKSSCIQEKEGVTGRGTGLMTSSST